jgi:hypothetical protein
MNLNPSLATCSPVGVANQWRSQPLRGGSHLLRGLGNCLTGEKSRTNLPDGLGNRLTAYLMVLDTAYRPILTLEHVNPKNADAE